MNRSKNNWIKLASMMELDLNMLARTGLTTKGQINVMNNIGAYLPIDRSTGKDYGVVLMEMIFSMRSYERRSGEDGRYLAPWLAEKLDRLNFEVRIKIIGTECNRASVHETFEQAVEAAKNISGSWVTQFGGGEVLFQNP